MKQATLSQQWERALVEEAKYDVEAFVQLYDAYLPRVYRYFLFRVRERQVAEDLTSIVFERVLAKLNTYRAERGSFASWVFGIAQNAFINYHHRQRRERAISLEEVSDLASEEWMPERELLRRGRRRELDTCIASLSPREQEIIALKFGSGFTNRYIAELMGLSETNVGTILYRAVRKIRDKLIKEEGFSEGKR